MSERHIRPVTPFDLAMLAALHGEAFPDEPWNEAALTSVLKMPGAFGRLSIGEDAAPEGFTLGLLIGPECELLSIGVAQALRRHGVATRLVADFLTVAAETGAEEVFLEVAEDNVAAQCLYSAHEFDRIGRRPDYYRRPRNTRVAALQLRKKLR